MNDWNDEYREAIESIWAKAPTDGQYATAAAILHLSRTIEINLRLVGLGKTGVGEGLTIGCLKKIAMELEEIKHNIETVPSRKILK
jgi:hypothetical protein